MQIDVRNPSHCPCGEKWLTQNKDGSKLGCIAGHSWEYENGTWKQKEDKNPLRPWRKVVQTYPARLVEVPPKRRGLTLSDEELEYLELLVDEEDNDET